MSDQLYDEWDAAYNKVRELEAELEFMSTIQEANDVEITALMEDNVKLERQLTELREALERLARLGNGDKYGNSEGNVIAQDALKALLEVKDAPEAPRIKTTWQVEWEKQKRK
jgi:hypothetical protein